MDFWENTLPLMNKMGVKQKDIAYLTGHSSGRICDWINRKITPKADDAVKIADRLGVSVRYLVTGEDDNELSPREKELLSACKLMSGKKFAIVLNTAKSVQEDMEQELSAHSYISDSDKISGFK